MNMVLRSQNGRIHDPFLIFQNQGCTYSIQGCPYDVLGMTYRTSVKDFMIGVMWIDYLNEPRAIQLDSLGRRKLIYMDNCASHNDSTQALLTTNRLNMEIRNFLQMQQICVNQQTHLSFQKSRMHRLSIGKPTNYNVFRIDIGKIKFVLMVGHQEC